MKYLLSFAFLTISFASNAKDMKEDIADNSIVNVQQQCRNAATAAVNTLEQFGIANTMQENGYTLSQNVYASTYYGCMQKNEKLILPSK